MELFSHLPIELENIIWEYTGLFKLRNGRLVRQIKHYPPKIATLFQNQECIGGFNLSKLLGSNYMFRLNKHVIHADLHFRISKDIFQDNILFSTKLVGKYINNEWVEL